MKSNSIRCALGVDPGGTKCEAILVRDDGTVLGWGKAQEPGLSGRSDEMVSLSVRRALGTVDFDELQITYLRPLPPLDQLSIKPAVKVRDHRVTETDGALALVGEEYGMVVVAGTGARVWGRTRNGRALGLDGLGPILGDVGGAYQIGYTALRAAVRAVQHPRHQTSMKDRIFDACCRTTEQAAGQQPVAGVMAKAMAAQAAKTNPDPAAQRLGELVRFSLTPHDRSVIASLARIVDDEANAGDAVAIKILKESASQMAEMLRDLFDLLKIGDDEYVLVGTGSVAMKSNIWWGELCRLVKEFAPQLKPVRSPLPPVAGIALVGLWQLDGIDRATVAANLFASVKLKETNS